jgi:hypothetical protein
MRRSVSLKFFANGKHLAISRSTSLSSGSASGAGHMLMECDDLVSIHKFCSMLPAFVFEVHPVIPVEEAVRGEVETIAWRDGLKRG